MTVFQPSIPITTDLPVIEVTVDDKNPLPVGKHIFELRVVDDSGNESDPAILELIVRDTTRPTAILDGPGEVEAGQPFKLSGERSSDVAPGRVVRYVWILRDTLR
jgi:hypothetical protein